MDSVRTNRTFPKTSREPFLIRKRFYNVRGTTMKNYLTKLWKHLCLNLFAQGKWKCSVDPMSSGSMVDWALTFSPLLNGHIQIWKKVLLLCRSRHNFSMISDNPNVSIGNVDCSYYTRRNVLKVDYHQKRMDLFAYTLLVLNYSESLAKSFIIPARQSQFIQKEYF